MPAVGDENGKIRVRLALPEKDHHELRILAAKSGLSMSQYAEQVLQEAINRGRVLKEK